jgi:hypothetical protein
VVAKYKVAPKVVWKRVDDEVVLIDPEKDSYSYLNCTGSDMWEMLMEGRERDEIAREIYSRYNITEEQASRDVESLLKKLLACGLLEIEVPGPQK